LPPVNLEENVKENNENTLKKENYSSINLQLKSFDAGKITAASERNSSMTRLP
jgi:hypothetical protein